ncbi:hepatic sodium/bile acid cotransporter-like [Babylonia areolata]|uniref:hepatic sodium/bile acid cotransporter-like n=1 Tax=Babylonia areolata TaxID=304850 RepID=UPI003FD55832
MAETTPFDLDSHFNLTSELPPDKTAVSFEGRQEIVVIRQHRAIDTAFNVVVVLLVVIVNLGVGCKTDLGVIKATLRRPIAPVTGFFSQFLIMPLISYAAVKAFQFEPALALGFFALGCSPGGSASNAYTMLLDGDVSLSITMTFISTLAALALPLRPRVDASLKLGRETE